MNILIVDDEPNARKTLSKILKVKGFEVEEAGTGSEAVASCEAKFFNLVLIDVRLPDTSGLEVLKAVRALNEDTIAIMTTAYASLDTSIEAMNKGAYSYITKPMNMDAVLAVIEKGFENQRLSLENKRLLKEERRLATVVRDSSDAITLKDFDGKITAWNHGAELMYGYSEKEALQMHFRHLAPPNKEAEHAEFIRRLMAGETIHSFETQRVTKDGRILDVWLTVTKVVDDTGKPIGIATTERDITERKKSEYAIKEALKAKSAFTSMVSHELRTPLSALKESVSQVLEGMLGTLTEGQKKLLEISKRNVDRLARLITEVLDFQTLETGKMPFKIQDNDINKVVEEIKETMNIVAKEKGLDFILNLDKELPKIKFDRDKISQVLSNLVNNSLKLTEKGNITISTTKGNNIVQVSVKDTGPGIKEEDMPRLFQHYEQLERKVGGTGLGLAISLEIIKAHGGKIWAESIFGHGTTMHFILPIEERRRQR